MTTNHQAENHMNRQANVGSSFGAMLFGAAVGAVATALFTTERGNNLRSSMMSHMARIEDKIRDLESRYKDKMKNENDNGNNKKDPTPL